jgi:hypothetical protein
MYISGHHIVPSRSNATIFGSRLLLPLPPLAALLAAAVSVLLLLCALCSPLPLLAAALLPPLLAAAAAAAARGVVLRCMLLDSLVSPWQLRLCAAAAAAADDGTRGADLARVLWWWLRRACGAGLARMKRCVCVWGGGDSGWMRGGWVRQGGCLLKVVSTGRAVLLCTHSSAVTNGTCVCTRLGRGASQPHTHPLTVRNTCLHATHVDTLRHAPPLPRKHHAMHAPSE